MMIKKISISLVIVVALFVALKLIKVNVYPDDNKVIRINEKNIHMQCAII